jgi:murein DD-endopeptidase MepM/ murein hydrolase activator NlpD
MRVFPVSVVVPAGPYELRNARGRACSGTRLWYRDDFAAPRGGGRYRHEATDIFAPQGSLVLAPEGGEVIGARETPRGGLLVELLAVDGRGRGRRYLFSHLESVAVEVGQVLEAGATLGTVGRTGNAAGTCPHLHLGIRKAWRDPRTGRVGLGAAVNPFVELARLLPIPPGGLQFRRAETFQVTPAVKPSSSTSASTDPSSSPEVSA